MVIAFCYNGKVKKFAEKKDYTLSYANNRAVYTYNEGDAGFDENMAPQLIITPVATGSLGGTAKRFFFTIADASKSITNAKAVTATTRLVDKNFTGYAVELDDYEVNRLLVKSQNGKAPDSPTDADYLKANKDFILSYSNNTNAGTAKVTITGIGEYYGSRTLTYKITKKTITTVNIGELSVSMDGIDVTAGTIPEYDYTGLAIKPQMTIVDSMGAGTDYTLVEGKDYSVSYGNNTNISTIDAKSNPKNATAKITFKGNYAGVAREQTNAITKNFRINSWDLSDANTLFYVGDTELDGINELITCYNNGKDVKPAVSVYRKVSADKKVQINSKVLKFTYENNKVVANWNDTLAPTIKIAPANKNITAPPVGNKNYVTRNFSIIKGDLSDTSNVVVAKIATQIYKGKDITPKVTVKYLGVALRQDRDYTVEYIDNNYWGKAKVIIKAVEGSAFTGQTETTFLIR